MDCIFSKHEKTTELLNGFAKSSNNYRGQKEDVNPKEENEPIQTVKVEVNISSTVSSCDKLNGTIEEFNSNNTLKQTNGEIQFGSLRGVNNCHETDNSNECEQMFGIEESASKTINNTEQVSDSTNSICDTNKLTVGEDRSRSTDSPLNISQVSVCNESDTEFLKDVCFTSTKHCISDVVTTSTHNDLIIDPPTDSTSDSKISSFPNVNSKQNYSGQVNVQFDSKCDSGNQQRQTVEINVTIADLYGYVQESQERKSNTGDELRVRFRAVIDPTKNQQAEQELSREISKDMFARVNNNFC